jgi:hypothetical protein
MEPWQLLALLAAAFGVTTLAASAAAQATASMPRVTRVAEVTDPTPGINGQWDLWVVGLNGVYGMQMLQMIPGHQFIYIPAALVMAQPTNKDWVYTFTPRGQTQPFSIVVPAGALQYYATLPKSRTVVRAAAGNTALQTPNWLYALQHSSNPCGVLDPSNIMNQVQSAISSFPKDGSDASAYVGWAATNITTVVTDAQQVAQCLSSGQLSDPGGVQTYLNTAIPQLVQLAAKAATAGGQAVANALGSALSSGKTPSSPSSPSSPSTPSSPSNPSTPS